MNLFIPTGIFHPDSGGPATYLYRFLPELQARGHRVRVLTFGEGDTDGYPYPLTRVSLRQGLIKRRRAYLEHYQREAGNAHLIYINNLGLPRSTAAAPQVIKVVGDYAWERAVNRGWVAPETDIDQFQTSFQNPLVQYLKWSRAREVRQVARVIVPSEYLRRMVIGWGAPPERVQVIYNALETAHYPQQGAMGTLRRELGLEENRQYLLTAARLTAWKGVDYLIRALPHVPNFHLLIAGDGPQLAILQQLAAGVAPGQVTFLGKVPHERMGKTMGAADYFILYSGYEGLSHVLLEALSAGTPLLASDRGGNPEVVRDGWNGLLIKHPDLDALMKVLKTASSPELRAKLAANAGAGLEKFSWSALVDQTVAALEAVYHRASGLSR
jgi:glycosyltransferase involved in cell wall biosynthesis